MDSNSFNIKDTTIIIHNTFYLMRSQEKDDERKDTSLTNEKEKYISYILYIVYYI